MNSPLQVVAENESPVQVLQYFWVRVPVTVLCTDLDHSHTGTDRFDKATRAAVLASVMSDLEHVRREWLPSAQQPLFTGLTGIARQQDCELTVDQLQDQRPLVLVMLLKVVQRLFRRWPQRPQRDAVTEIQPATRTVVVGPAESLLRADFEVRDANWIRFEAPPSRLRAQVKIRYRSVPAWAEITPLDGLSSRASVVFDKPQRAVTPGQAAVFYDGDVVVGGGWIC